MDIEEYRFHELSKYLQGMRFLIKAVGQLPRETTGLGFIEHLSNNSSSLQYINFVKNDSMENDNQRCELLVIDINLNRFHTIALIDSGSE